jgi:carboxymethylenebutenolidase
MESSTVEIPMPEGVADAYVARPDGRAYPGVLFVADAFGLRPTVEEMVDRIAADGYVVLAPNVFYRARRAPVVSSDLSDPEQYAAALETIRPLMEQLTPERIGSDGIAYLDYLSSLAAAAPIAITGYCMGGRAGWRITAADPARVAALAAFHTGGLVTDDPESPHRSVAALTGADVYFGFADNDRGMTATQIATLEGALDEAGVRYRAEIYEGAEHGYTMADLPAYDQTARERHFRELRVLLERALRP